MLCFCCEGTYCSCAKALSLLAGSLNLQAVKQCPESRQLCLQADTRALEWDQRAHLFAAEIVEAEFPDIVTLQEVNRYSTYGTQQYLHFCPPYGLLLFAYRDASTGLHILFTSRRRTGMLQVTFLSLSCGHMGIKVPFSPNAAPQQCSMGCHQTVLLSSSDRRSFTQH